MSDMGSNSDAESNYTESSYDAHSDSMLTETGLPVSENEPSATSDAYVPYTVTYPVTDEAAILSDMNERLHRMEQTLEGLKGGVNTIGTMMNNVAEAFDQVVQKVNQGGIGALLGGFMGGNKNG